MGTPHRSGDTSGAPGIALLALLVQTSALHVVAQMGIWCAGGDCRPNLRVGDGGPSGNTRPTDAIESAAVANAANAVMNKDCISPLLPALACN